jgi:adenylate cyclase
LNHLTRLQGLRVISRTSSFQFRDTGLTIAEVGQRLDATYVAEGSIRSMGDALRVGVQLVDARTDATIWSKTYDRRLSDIFALQDEIAADVAGELHEAVSRQARQRVSAAAYQLVLRAKHLAKQFTRDALTRSNELLLEATTLEPDYTDAWNCLAANYGTQVGEGFLPLTALEDARAAIERVRAIDPDDVEALSGLAWLALRFDNDLPRAAEYLQRALAKGLNNIPVLNSAGGLLIRMRRPAEAILVAKHVAKLDPLNSFAFANLGVYSLFAGSLDEAIDAYRTALEISPGFVGGHFAIGLAQLLKGEPELALASMGREADDEFRTKGSAFAHFSLGDGARFQRELDHLIDTWGADWPSEVSEVYAWAGMEDEAFQWMNRDPAGDGAGWAECVVNPVYHKLHDDPRWLAFLERFGLGPVQLARIDFRLPEGLQVLG